MRKKNAVQYLVFKSTRLAVCLVVSLFVNISTAGMLTPIEELGQFLYFDENLSEPAGQSCATCHDPAFGFADPDKGLPVSEGVIPGLFGGRNSPSTAYAMFAPIRFFHSDDGLWIGGQFWDSRATGEILGDPLADAALGPFLNPVQMANPNKAAVIADVAASDYAELFEQVWGLGSLDNVEIAYDQVALSIAAFERTKIFGQFSSKYDAYLKSCLELEGVPEDCAKGRGEVAAQAGSIFSKKEWRGLQLFMGENNNDGILESWEGAMCSACHVADWMPAAAYPGGQVPEWAPDGMVPPLFTNFAYDNVGIPKSQHELLADAPIDLGLGAIVDDSEEYGKFKIMSLRNIHQTAPYGHNGFFKKLADITHFFNTRDVSDEGWAEPEYPDTVNNYELGNLGLTDKDEGALVKFMKSLSDGFTP